MSLQEIERQMARNRSIGDYDTVGPTESAKGSTTVTVP